MNNNYNNLTILSDMIFSKKLLKIFIIFFIISSVNIFSQIITGTEEKVRSVAEAVLQDAAFNFIDNKTNQIYNSLEDAPGDATIQPKSAYNDWRYWNGVLNISMIKLGEILNEKSYIKFAEKNIAFGFDSYNYFQDKHSDENKWNYPFGQFFILEELDDGGAMGASVIEVYKKNQEKRYKNYIDKVSNQMMNEQERLEDDSFVRTFPHEYTLWADDLYMGLSFISRMGELTGDMKYFNDAANQVINYHKYLFDEEKEIMYHCWYSDVQRNGVAFWGRANGWALVAQVDLLDRLPENHPKRDTLLSLLQRHILGVAKYQGPDGLWHQLLDKTDSYLETSCSAMFTYTIARAVNKGYIEPRYKTIAQRGWEGVMTKILPDSKVEGVCTGTVVSDDLVYYYHRPAPLNDVHGIGAIILAGAEMLLLK